MGDYAVKQLRCPRENHDGHEELCLRRLQLKLIPFGNRRLVIIPRLKEFVNDFMEQPADDT